MKTRRMERTKMIALRLKPTEHRWLVAEAERMYLPLSAYVRHKLFAGVGGPPAKRVRRK